MKYYIKADLHDFSKIFINEKEKILNENYTYIDGWIEEPLDNYNPISNKNYTGVYNIIYFDIKNNKIFIENDILGQRPLYFGFEKGCVHISDNFWKVYSSLSLKIIDQDSINQLSYFRRLVPPSKTLAKNICRIPAGNKLIYELDKSEPKIIQTKLMKQQVDSKIDDETAAEELNSALIKTFKQIKKLYANKKIYFGNSGGLDSRLIPAYCEKLNIHISGYLVHNNNNKTLLNQTASSSRQIAKIYNIDCLELNYDEDNGWDRLIQDIYVSPLGPANFHKNPKYILFKNNLILCGGNSFLIANDNNFWKDAIKAKDSIASFVNKYLKRSNTPNNITYEYIEKIKKTIPLAKLDKFSLMRTMHQSYLNITSPMGGFESMSFSGEFQYMYHPYATLKSFSWPEKLFYDRQVQKKLFKIYHQELLEIPDQKHQYIENHANIKQEYINELMRLRGHGLDYYNWDKSPWYYDILQKLININPTFKNKIVLNEYFENFNDKIDFLKLMTIKHILEDPSIIHPKLENDNSN